MEIKLNHKIIKDMCGTVSFKRGDVFYRTNKVAFKSYHQNKCEARVTGVEDFHVTIEKNPSGGINSSCSCPKLGSYQKDCQHIAAVLLVIYEHQRHETVPFTPNELDSNSNENDILTHGLLTLFNDTSIRPSGHQLHFEKREILEVEFTYKPLIIGKEQHLFGLEIKVGPNNVQHIRKFLEQVKNGNPSFLYASFTYDPTLHCFQKETDAVIQKLIEVIDDEQAYLNTLSNKSHYEITDQMILIPPSSWERLAPILKMSQGVKLISNGTTYRGIHLSEEKLPLQFEISVTEKKDYQLKVKGLKSLIIMNPYRVVLSKGKLVQMETEDCKRLLDLKQMLPDSDENLISIPKDQIGFFIEKVVPGLKKLGEVKLNEAITKQLAKTPLTAKLYLDRLKNRLLVGLEFHYENIMINPLEGEPIGGPLLIRDEDKEKAILSLMEESSFAKTDGGYFVHNEELEYEFLYNIVPKLNKLVQIYATTAVRNRIYRGNNPPKIRIKVKKERTNWLEFKFELDGFSENHIREILVALEEKRKYYRLQNGSLLSLETKEFEDIQHFLKALPVQPEDLERGLDVPIARGLRFLDSVNHDKTFKLEESFRQFIENLHNPASLEFEIPPRLSSVLRDYQKHGYKWMKLLSSFGFGGILADDMGLGKTLQSISFIVSELPNIRSRRDPVLIVCPSSLKYNWLSEFMKFAPEIQAVVIDGNKKERSIIQKEVLDIDVMITSYPLLRKDVQWFEKQNFHTVFFDEAQAFKNPLTQTARSVKRIKADHRFALTGTPVENSLEELWSIFHVVFPELFMGLKEYSNLPRKTIAKRIRPFMLRRIKEDVLSELPNKVEFTESVELHSEQKKLYAAYLAKLRHDTLKHLDKDTLRKNRIKILAGLTRLRQICCHPALFVDGYKGSSAKFEQLLQIIKESKLSGRRVLIFSQFTKMLELIGRELVNQGVPYFYLDGKTPSEERVEICNRFNLGERDLFLISLKAGGTGLNLASADTVILYDNWWNPAVEDQAAGRAHRMGQTNEVQIIKLVTRGTIEEKMNELQEKKKNLIGEIIDSKDKATSTLTDEDIKEILMI